MELTLVPLAYNLDAVLKRLDGVSSERKLRKKDLEQIFENIMADESGNKTSEFNAGSFFVHFFVNSGAKKNSKIVSKTQHFGGKIKI